jgi:hypothetical protein
MISIVGFGRPKFKNSGSTVSDNPVKNTKKSTKEEKTCQTCGQTIK